MIKIHTIRHMYPEKAGFLIDRPRGHKKYTFLHFHGSVELSLNGEKIVTAPHGVILYRPGTPQYFLSRGPLLHDWFHFEASPGELPLSDLCPDRICYPSCHALITKTVAELETEFFAENFGSEVLCDGKIKELFIRLERDLTKKEKIAVDSDTLEKFRFLRGEMFSSLDKHLSIGQMAEKINLSPSRFFTLYKSIFGTSPGADLIYARMSAAKNKLIFGGDRIDQIAADLGYENTTHFIRQFKDRVGTTPAAYRKNHRR